jgi:hypothetical protein
MDYRGLHPNACQTLRRSQSSVTDARCDSGKRPYGTVNKPLSPKLVDIFSGESGASVLLDMWEGAKFIPNEESLEVAEYEAARCGGDKPGLVPKG